MRMGDKQKGSLLAVSVLLWLAGYWFFSDGWWHRRWLWWMVLPVALVQLPALLQTARRDRWLHGAALLLLFQAMSTLWTGPVASKAGSWEDTAAVAMLLVSLAHLARTLPGFPRLFALTFLTVSTLSALVSLLVFYSCHSLANDRLRNIYVYETGLNPVLTGLLLSFGCLCALALISRERDRRTSRFLQWCIAGQAFALSATQSRTAMLALGTGLAVLILCQRDRIRSLLAPVLAGAGAHVLVLLLAPEGGAAMTDLIERGSTGRLDIYRAFFGEMQGRDHLLGKGMGADSTLEAKVLGWPVAHPHNSYLTQYFLTGLVGLGLLALVLAQALRASLRALRHGDALWLALLAAHGIALCVDGGRLFSLSSIPRIEFLLLAVPAAIVTNLPRPDLPERDGIGNSYPPEK